MNTREVPELPMTREDTRRLVDDAAADDVATLDLTETEVISRAVASELLVRATLQGIDLRVAEGSIVLEMLAIISQEREEADDDPYRDTYTVVGATDGE